MTLDKQIEKMIKRYPTLYGRRTDALNHLFCVNGNGYEWVNGELTDKYVYSLSFKLKKAWRYFMYWRPRKKKDDFASFKRKLPKYIQEEIDITRNFDKLLYKFRKKNARVLAQVRWSKLERDVRYNSYQSLLHTSVYPLCEYAKMCNVPADVKPDWLAGVREIAHVVADGAVVITEDDDNDEHWRNVKIAELVLAHLEQRFGKE